MEMSGVPGFQSTFLMASLPTVKAAIPNVLPFQWEYSVGIQASSKSH